MYKEYVIIVRTKHYPIFAWPQEAEMRPEYKEARARDMWAYVSVMEVRSGSRQHTVR